MWSECVRCSYRCRRPWSGRVTSDVDVIVTQCCTHLRAVVCLGAAPSFPPPASTAVLMTTTMMTMMICEAAKGTGLPLKHTGVRPTITISPPRLTQSSPFHHTRWNLSTLHNNATAVMLFLAFRTAKKCIIMHLNTIFMQKSPIFWRCR